MVELKSLLVTLLVWTGDANTFRHNQRPIMTPNNGQSGNAPLSQGNIDEIAMFQPQSNNNLVPDSTESGTTCINKAQTEAPSTVPSSANDITLQTEAPPIVPTFANDITLPDISVETTTTPAIFETVTTIGGTVIKIEIPSSINIFVNITNSEQPVVVEIPPVVSNVEISTVDTSTADSSTVEISTVSSAVEVSTTQVTHVDRSIDLTTVDSTSTLVNSSLITDSTPLTSSPGNTEISTVESNVEDSSTVSGTVEEVPEEMLTSNTVEIPTTASTVEIPTTASTVEMPTIASTVEMPTIASTVEMPTSASTVEMPTTASTVEIPTTGSTVEISTADSTTEISITSSTVEMSTVDNTVEILTTQSAETSSNTENSSIAAPTTINDSSTEAMRYIQININLSDNSQNGNFGFTTPSTGNLGHLQNKMIYKQKCDEYYANSRVGREAKVTVFIVGGTSSTPKEFPHMAALGYGNDSKKEWLCGGSLISENYVITAGHCLTSKAYGNVKVVRLGTTRLDTETLNSEDFNVIRRISHPLYSTEEQYDDIALLQLDRPVTFSEYVSPICLYSSNVTDEVLIASGWGKTEATGDVSPELQKVELEYFPNIECQNSYSRVSKEELPRGIVAESQICAGSRTEEKDTCQGDSGGPLQIKENGRMYLVGITSFGIACGHPGRPGVYTRVSHYIPWIENIVWASGR